MTAFSLGQNMKNEYRSISAAVVSALAALPW
jgi:hypothetical protein